MGLLIELLGLGPWGGAGALGGSAPCVSPHIHSESRSRAPVAPTWLQEGPNMALAGPKWY
eukprot:3612643-Pyramimonas_sp.AAC.1